ncbi:MAG TPA: alpha/beta hydrolase [Ktedonobacteraceae bacterium]|nr:alpha/beta hydrolase [Ktedonobacteraceae bacterium]
MLTEHYFTTPVVTLNYAEGEASGSPLVLLHGGSARWQSALPIVPELSQQWQVYAPDLRGHGRSGRVPGSYRLTDYTADIVTFLQQVVKHPAVLFGHSLGGEIAILIAARYPKLVRGLIIGDAPLDLATMRSTNKRDRERLLYWREWAGPGRSTEEIAAALKNTPIAVEGKSDPVAARTLFGEEHPWFQWMAENLQHNDPDMLTAVLEFDQMHEGYDYQRLFPLIACPTLIIQGSPAHGALLTNEEIEQALRLLPSATVARMKTVGHPLHTQEKEEVLLAMTTFLKML